MSGEFDLENHRKILLDIVTNPISKRTQSAFYLRTNGSQEAVEVIIKALQIREDSALMRHELAYILGQMQNSTACKFLSEILEDETDDLLVRHECAEALGAIGDISSIDVLTKYSKHPSPEIAETCLIALDLIDWRSKGEKTVKSQNFLSVDPAPPISTTDVTVDQLQKVLMDTSLSLFTRYRAMFALRNINTNSSALALVTGLKDSSALFRHEVAYVLGQMELSVAIEGLRDVLVDRAEHRMVRHEAAESLGNIGGPVVNQLLQEYRDDDEVVVKESCVVALDAMEYWSNFSSSSSFASSSTAAVATPHNASH
jgi:deoxyhypusine monooxygenase